MFLKLKAGSLDEIRVFLKNLFPSKKAIEILLVIFNINDLMEIAVKMRR